VQVALNVTVPPFAAIEFVVVAMLPLPLALWQAPPLEALQVHEQLVRLGGNVSLMPAFVAIAVAALVAVIVYVVFAPAFTLGAPSLMLIDKSPCVRMLSVSVALLFALLASFA